MMIKKKKGGRRKIKSTHPRKCLGNLHQKPMVEKEIMAYLHEGQTHSLRKGKRSMGQMCRSCK